MQNSWVILRNAILLCDIFGDHCADCHSDEFHSMRIDILVFLVYVILESVILQIVILQRVILKQSVILKHILKQSVILT
jgi:hypothetical protein